jgi:heat shock protein 4
MVHYADGANLMEGLPSQIAQYSIGEASKDEKTEKVSFTMRVSNNIHNVASLDEVEFIQEWTEEEKIPTKASPITPPAPPKADAAKEGEKAKDGEAKPEGDKPAGEEPPPLEEEKKAEPVVQPEQTFETKQRTKKNFSKIKFSTQSFALSPAVRGQMLEAENALKLGDVNILQWKELRNNLEAYSYEMRSNLDSYGTFEKYLAEEPRKAFVESINVVVEWLYEAGETASKEEYAAKLKEFRAIGDPVKQRHFYYSELDIYFK